MTFSSTIFIFMFLPITLLVNYSIKTEYRNVWLLVVSMLFYAWYQPRCLWILLFSIAINYLFALLCQIGQVRNLSLFIGLVLNLVLLGYFKYANFIVQTINSISHKNYAALDMVLPVGISFYTFKGISYLVDAYVGRVIIQKNPIKVAIYLSMFPQIMSGPIEKYGNISSEINNRQVTLDDLSAGIERFIIGLSKKVILANSLGEIVDTIWNQGAGSSYVSVAWLGSIAYTLQIFFDFAGYSDMAIGIGRMLGFHFSENFDYPYLSKSVTEFWRRWHITLGRWFRDYVYIPLGGNKKRLYLNLAIVFLLTGLWHGASWNFVLWGIFHGIFMLIERVIKSKRSKKSDSKVAEVLSHIYLLFVVNLGWILFRAESLETAVNYIKSMMGVTAGDMSGLTLTWYMTPWNVMILLLAIVFSSRIPSAFWGKIESKTNTEGALVIKHGMLTVIFVFSILRVINATYSSFIYFKF